MPLFKELIHRITPKEKLRPNVLGRVFVFCLLIVSLRLNAQEGWREWEKIYSDEFILVELQLYYSDNSCEDLGKQYKYRTRVTGQYRSFPFFVNWKMNYFDCNGVLYYQNNYTEVWKMGGGGAFGIINESLDNRFTASSILEPYYEVNSSKIKKYDSGFMSKGYSLNPSCIDFVTSDGATKLTVEGKYLGSEADWYWYQGSCKGKLIGKGASITVKPEETTSYFVKAEGAGYSTSCIQTTIVVKKVMKLDLVDMKVKPTFTMEVQPGKETQIAVVNIPVDSSIAPASIIGPSSLCKGDSTILRVYHGHLAPGSEWVWYSSESRTASIGSGDSIFVKPEKKTIYYVKAEGRSGKTKSVSFTINVQEKSNITYSIIYKGKPTLCPGQKVELEVDNYVTEFDGIWNWYSDSCNCEILGTGAFIEFYPTRTTTYYLRRDGFCNSFDGASVTIHVNPNSEISNAHIVSPDTVFYKENAKLFIRGGILGEGSKWYWYKDSCVSYNFIGNGDTVTINTRQPRRYFVQAKGPCNVTPAIEVKILPYQHSGIPVKEKESFIQHLIEINKPIKE